MRNVWFFQYSAEKSLRSQFQQVQSITLYIPFLTEKGHLSFTFLWLLQLVNYLPFDIPKVRKRYFFRVEHPRIGHYMECPPPTSGNSDKRLYYWDQHLQPVNGALPYIMCIYSNHCAPFFSRLYTTNPRHRNSVLESGTATTSQFHFVQTRDQINNNIPSIYVSYLLQLYKISV